MHWGVSQKLCFLLLKQKNQLGVQERNIHRDTDRSALYIEPHLFCFMDFRCIGLVASQILEELHKLG